MNRVVIIGAGVGGLFTGAILAKEGYEVTLLEKNATIGGGLQSFSRFGETFDTGMHVIGGMRPGGNVRRICSYLGILDKMRIMDVDDDCTDLLYFAEDHATYRIAKGEEGFAESLAAYFPEEADNLRRYVKAVIGIADEVDLFNLRPTNGQITLLGSNEEMLMAADDFIARYVKSPQLRSVLAYMNPLYGGRAHTTPAYIHAIISTLYIHGASRLVGGSQHVADLLAEVIREHGGRIVTGDGASRIEVSDRWVTGVRTEKGCEYHADYYISAIHPCSMLSMMDEGALPKSYRLRIDSIPNAHSAFSLYIKMRDRSFPYINHSEYYMTRYADVWNFSDAAKPWPLGFLLMTPPEVNQGEWSRKVLVTAPMPFEMVSQWEHTRVGHRGEDYEAWKRERTEELLRQIEDMHPGFGNCIEAINTASPLTIRDYYGVKEGSICGFSKDCHNIALSQVPVVTKVRNLLLTGQNNNLHGFCGVPLTAINTCEAIMGLNKVIYKMRNEK